MSLLRVVLAAHFATAIATADSSATAAANDSGVAVLAAPWAGPKAAPPSTLPDSEVIAAGLSNDEIANRLYVSGSTVKTHVGRAMMKLAAGDRAQLRRVRV